MKKRHLFVFAGQSNMMGACVYPPKRKPETKNSYEYLYKDVHLGSGQSRFRPSGFPCGEFLYSESELAYPSGDASKLSALCDYARNTYFVPGMCNLKNECEHTTDSFSVYSEENFIPGPSLPVYLAEEWEKRGHACAYAHIAKGGISILHYFNDEMLEEYREILLKKYPETTFPLRTIDDMCRGASKCFQKKCISFFRESENAFPKENTSVRCLIWLQGESDAHMSKTEYQALLEVLWKRAQNIGFTHFFMIRVGYFGNDGIVKIMKAQEAFCKDTENAFMLTRACSFMPFENQPDGWFISEPNEKYQLCRDSFLGFPNPHINEKGFCVIAKKCAESMENILVHHTPARSEDELITFLKESTS